MMVLKTGKLCKHLGPRMYDETKIDGFEKSQWHATEHNMK